jgi:arylsulfatase A-like enzyme
MPTGPARFLTLRRCRHWLSALVLSLPLLAGTGCDHSQVVYDFVDAFPSAQAPAESALIDFGTPAAHAYLLDGWSTDDERRSFVWAVGESSSIRLFIGEPRQLAFVVRCWPFTWEKGPIQTITFIVNDHPVADLRLHHNSSEYRVAIPAEALLWGENRVVFRYAYSQRPMDVIPGSTDARPLAVAWDSLSIKGVRSVPTPRVQTDDHGAALIVPFASQVDYYLPIAPGSELAIDGISPSGSTATLGDGSYLQVELQTVGSDTQQTAELQQTAKPSRIPVPVSAQQLARISFRAVRAEHSGAADGLQVKHPVLRAPKPPVPPPAHCDAPAVDGHPQRPNVFIYLIDTLRADHLGCYGYAKPTSPHIDAFAREATLFRNAQAQCSWTRPSVASVFTGMTTRGHGVHKRDDILGPTQTLARLLQDAGYETAGFITNGQVSEPFGLSQGFKTYEHLRESKSAEVHQLSDRLNEAAFQWLEHRPAGRPIFLYLHATDPHAPYMPRSPFREQFAPDVTDPQTGSLDTVQALLTGHLKASDDFIVKLIELYDAEIAFVDAQFGIFLQKLKDLGLYESSVIVLVADHGEAFNDHGRWEHANSLFEELLNVPLVIKFPDGWGGGKTVASMARQMDILPTVLDVLHEPVPAAVQGRSLLPLLICPDEGREDRRSYAYLGGFGGGIEMESLLADNLKLIHYIHYDRPRPDIELYDVANDPKEEHNLAATRSIEAGYLRSMLPAYQRRSQAAPAVQSPAVIDDALNERLRALGY